MAYRIVIPPRVQKHLNVLPKSGWQLVRHALDRLSDNHRASGSLKMRGRSDSWRIRAGNFRIVYSIEDDQLIILVIKIGHRRDVYR